MDAQDMMVKVTATLAKELALDGAKRLAGPLWDTLSKRIRKGVLGPRAKEVVTGAAHALAQAGQKPQQVPGRILFDLVQHASIEEEENLYGKWVALLANAGSPTEANKVLPSYVDTLRQLTPKQAEMLDWMYAQEVPPDVPGWHSRWPDFNRADLERRFGLSGADYALFVTDLERLGLIEPHRPLEKLKKQDVAVQLALISCWINDRVQYTQISLTALGIRFVEACKPPVRPRRVVP